MQDSNFITYIIVFLVVFVPYLFLQTFWGNAKKINVDFKERGIPNLYAKLYGILSIFTDSLGRKLVEFRPDFVAKMKNNLAIANVKMDVSYVLVAQLLLSMSFTIIAVLIMVAKDADTLWLIGVPSIVAFIMWVYPATIIESLANDRQVMITKSLPFAIDLIGSAMRAGIDFGASMRYYVSTAKEDNPLSVEFRMVLKQMELGKTRSEALEDMAARVQITAFTSFVGAVVHGGEVGASIVETIKVQGEEMRRARFNIAERKAARAPSLMILPIALFIMPAFFVVIGAPIFIKMQDSGMGGVL